MVDSMHGQRESKESVISAWLDDDDDEDDDDDDDDPIFICMLL